MQIKYYNYFIYWINLKKFVRILSKSNFHNLIMNFLHYIIITMYVKK